MNILMALSQREITGAEVYAVSLSDELIKRGHHVHILSDTLTKSTQATFTPIAFNHRQIWYRLWHIAYVVYVIKRHRIQLVHAHSRASSWICTVACQLTRTPMITTVHGRQPEHKTRKLFHAFGHHIIAICENIQAQLINRLNVPAHNISLIRNGISAEQFAPQPLPNVTKPMITIVGRLTGPKGRVCQNLLTHSIDLNTFHVRIVTASQLPPWCKAFEGKVEFLTSTDDMVSILAASHLVVGAGRVAMEGLLANRKVFAVGESMALGLITQENFDLACESNFGDIVCKQKKSSSRKESNRESTIDFAGLSSKFIQAVHAPEPTESLRERALAAFSLARISDHVEQLYQRVVVQTLRKEMPILTYHRFIEDEQGKGVHGIYVFKDVFESHLKMLKRLGYETLTFSDLAEKGMIHRLTYGKKYVMITVDDGYVDNLTLLKPLLEQYGFKATVYIVSGETYNRWDVQDPHTPERPLDLMNADQIKMLAASPAIEIGGHTLTHPRLTTLSADEQFRQIKSNKEQLEALIQKPLLSFAYPYGDVNEEVKQCVQKAGYPFAVATTTGPLVLSDDRYEIRRIGVFPRTSAFGLWRKVRGNYVFRKAT